MTSTDETSYESVEITNRENAKTLFDAAVQFTLAEGNFVWSRFSAVMVAQSIIALIFGQALFTGLTETNSLTARIFAIVFAIIFIIGGLVLCRVWTPITDRSFGYQNFYLMSARELADNFLKISDPRFKENFLKRAGTFGHENHPIDFSIQNDSDHSKLEMPRSGNMTGRDAALQVIRLFNWFYILALVVTLIYLGVLVGPILPK